MFWIYPGHVSGCSVIFYSCFLFFFLPLFFVECRLNLYRFDDSYGPPCFSYPSCRHSLCSMIYVENLQDMDRCGKYPTEGFCRGNVVAGSSFWTCLVVVDDLDLYTALAYPLVTFSTLTFLSLPWTLVLLQISIDITSNPSGFL
ncbi:uncharacterized protein BDW47DRAFT_26956 [Aspergillus candidus]|uniref:Uncharacterized protein n=1 Tax=Aspergillus candidus TaxID=41067 RepID=A0A2I2FNX6_ASPCN|nr:hypothetical protein BDW47DRAFT_26956 [Aspergillus candidus]PLB42322.1 hypothetical protein BDW47DRAFT_26956 [Aspergillus candidus]